MRAVICSVTVLVLAGLVSAADEKIDGKKLLGKWEPAKREKDGPAMVLELADKGKFTLLVTSNGKTVKVEGTYTLKDNKMDVEMSFNGNTMKETLTILKLTDTELVTKGKADKEETLKRIKDK